jgi:hypothetical protein
MTNRNPYIAAIAFPLNHCPRSISVSLSACEWSRTCRWHEGLLFRTRQPDFGPRNSAAPLPRPVRESGPSCYHIAAYTYEDFELAKKQIRHAEDLIALHQQIIDRLREMDQSTRLPDRLMAKMQAGLEVRRRHLEEIVAELNEPALGDHD